MKSDQRHFCLEILTRLEWIFNSIMSSETALDLSFKRSIFGWTSSSSQQWKNCSVKYSTRRAPFTSSNDYDPQDHVASHRGLMRLSKHLSSKHLYKASRWERRWLNKGVQSSFNLKASVTQNLISLSSCDKEFRVTFKRFQKFSTF